MTALGRLLGAPKWIGIEAHNSWALSLQHSACSVAVRSYVTNLFQRSYTDLYLPSEMPNNS